MRPRQGTIVSKGHNRRLSLETLADRALPSATLAHGVLTVSCPKGTGHESYRVQVIEDGYITGVAEQIGNHAAVVTFFDSSTVRFVNIVGARYGRNFLSASVDVGCRLVGGARADVLRGGRGFNVLIGRGGADVADAQAGGVSVLIGHFREVLADANDIVIQGH